MSDEFDCYESDDEDWDDEIEYGRGDPDEDPDWFEHTMEDWEAEHPDA